MTPSRRRLIDLAVLVVLASSVSLVGCSSIGPVTEVAVSDVKSLSGTWQGTVYLPGSERDDVTLTISDDGSYEVVSRRSLAVTTGMGRILVENGRLVIEGKRGQGSGTVLRSPNGYDLMKVEMTLSDNSHLAAELWRTR
jgi:hypothetical protein